MRSTISRRRTDDETLTVPRYGGALVGPDQLRQVFNDTDAEVLWLIVGKPEELEFPPDAKNKPDLSLIYATDPTQSLRELGGRGTAACANRLASTVIPANIPVA